METRDEITSALLSHDIRAALSQIVHAGLVLESAKLSDEHTALLKKVRVNKRF